MKEFKEGSKINMTISGSNNIKFNIALLKAAYLEMFCLFGHDFLLNENTQRIREQITMTDKWILPHIFFLPNEFGDEFVGVNIIYQPAESKCFLVILELSASSSKICKRIGVLIPGPDEKAWKTYSDFKDANPHELTLAKFLGKSYITEKKHCLTYSRVWSQVSSGCWSINKTKV